VTVFSAGVLFLSIHSTLIPTSMAVVTSANAPAAPTAPQPHAADAAQLADDYFHAAVNANPVVLPGTLTFQAFVRHRQFSGNCSRVYSLHQHSFGLFSQIQGAAHSLLEALAHGYVFSWSNATTRYASEARCRSQSFECFFLPVTSCSGHGDALARRTSCVFNRATPDRRNAPHEWDNARRVDPVPRLRALLGLHGPEYGAHFFLREALRFIMRPNADLAGLVRDLLVDDLAPLPGWAPLSACATCRVGVHVRRGDKAKDWPVPSLAAYGEQLRVRGTVESAVGVAQLVVSSDEPALYPEVRALVAAPKNTNDADRIARQPGGNATVLAYIRVERFSGALTTLRKWHSANGDSGGDYDAGMLLIAQVYVFAACDMFLGVFSSNIGTTVHALMGALRGSAVVPAYDVMGSPWAACSIFSSSPFHPLKPMPSS